MEIPRLFIRRKKSASFWKGVTPIEVGVLSFEKIPSFLKKILVIQLVDTCQISWKKIIKKINSGFYAQTFQQFFFNWDGYVDPMISLFPWSMCMEKEFKTWWSSCVELERIGEICFESECHNFYIQWDCLIGWYIWEHYI